MDNIEIKTSPGEVKTPNVNAAFAAGSRRSRRLNRRFNYPNCLLFKTTVNYVFSLEFETLAK